MSGLSGFPEFLPAERNVELHVLDHLRRVFELHGFANVETRAVETTETLQGKGEIDKEVYVLKRIHAGDDEGDAGLALHYDLTVPFARYVLENAGRLEFPFRRYQIQRVWRGERPQQGRFREFTQADIDIVAKDELPFHFDVEVAQVMAEALGGLPVPQLTLQVSNRKVLEGFYLGLGVKEPTAVMQVIDKLDKMPADALATQLTDLGLTDEQTASCLALAEIATPDTSFVERVRELGVSHELLDTGLTELAQVIGSTRSVDGVTVMADLRIARGLDYYTGTVFETRMAGYEHLGSDLFGRSLRPARVRRAAHLPRHRHLPGCLAAARAAAGRRPDQRPLGTVDRPRRACRRGVARDQRRGRVPAARPRHPHRGRRHGPEVRQADPLRRAPGHPVRLVPLRSTRGPRRGWRPKVRDIRSGDQVEADPDEWSPPTDDLKPRIKEQHT